jgi:glycosyltransferase involved in cell wall biosynthesis
VSAPDVSVVMCVWNPRRDWFREAIRSVLDQVDCDLELVVVDDGSDEPVESLVADADDPRLRVVRVQHAGLSRARNAGIEVAAGRFLRFVDGDDVLEPRSCSRLLRLADGEETISYGATLVCDEQLRPVGAKTSDLEGWVAEACLLYRFDVRHMSMLFPRAVVEAVGEWDPALRQCQDWDYVLRALERAPVRGERDVATYYRRHGAAASANLRGAHRFETMVVDRYFERHPDRTGSPLEREARAKLLMVRAASCSALGDPRREQLRLIGHAFALHPWRAAEELIRTAGRPGRERGRAASAAVPG